MSGRSRHLTSLLRSMTKATVVPEMEVRPAIGMPEWIAAGLPIET
jgi:hypothetical protein